MEKKMTKNEELLIKKAQRGNLQAFEELVHNYDARVMKVIYDMINVVEDARDIYQEVFIKVYKSIKKFRFQSEFSTWLFRIAVNACIDFRKQRAKYQYDSLDDYLADNDKYWKVVSETESHNPEQQLLNIELNNKIQNSIDQLSSKQRAVFILRHYHGYKLNEIASIMECADGTVKNYLYRATQNLRKSLRLYQ